MACQLKILTFQAVKQQGDDAFQNCRVLRDGRVQKLKGYFHATGNLLTFAFEPKLDNFDGYFVRQKDISTVTDSPYTHADAELLLQHFKQEFV